MSVTICYLIRHGQPKWWIALAPLAAETRVKKLLNISGGWHSLTRLRASWLKKSNLPSATPRLLGSLGISSARELLPVTVNCSQRLSA